MSADLPTVTLALTLLAPAAGAQTPAVKVTHTVVADLGGEHLAKALHMRLAQGDVLAAWGERILTWTLTDPPRMSEAVPRRDGVFYGNGGCALDLDGDGADELVLSRSPTTSGNQPELVWFDPLPDGTPWVEHAIGSFGTGSGSSPHDMQPAEFKLANGKPQRGVVAVIARRELYWFEVPDPPDGPWRRHDIGTLPGKAQHSGMAVGDVNQDGRPDVVCGMFWAECPPDPRAANWPFHRLGDWDGNGWGGMGKNALADLDGDGVPEIISAEAEIPHARVGVFKQSAGHPEEPWEVHLLGSDWYCPHSLVTTDLDGDGRQDIVVGEMTAGGWSFPLNPRPKVVAYLNRGALEFEPVSLAEDAGTHEMGVIAPWQAGALLYAADEIQPHKFPDMVTRVHTWWVRP